MFAELAAEGHFYDAVIDLPDADAKPLPRPDLRRVNLPRGPVAVFGAGNFPLAFGVAGGDTASALAVGCPVVSKSHPGHRRTDQLIAELIDRAIDTAGLHPGTHGLVHADDPEESGAVVELPEVSSVAFTGSRSGGFALSERARRRAVPIPVYAEMGSTNPAIITPAAASSRGEALAETLADAVLNSAGQLCTKPGLILIPATTDGLTLSARLARLINSATPGPMLSGSIRDGYDRGAAAVNEIPGVKAPEDGTGSSGQASDQALPHLWEATVEAACREDRLTQEVFGPAAVVIRYEDEPELQRLLDTLEGQLSFSVFSEPSESDLVGRVTRRLEAKAGRIVFDAPTTGVSVTMAQQHGGPYPATLDDSYTSVGGAASYRFVRPVAFQDCPADLLPEALRDENPLGIRRTINGVSSRDPIAA